MDGRLARGNIAYLGVTRAEFGRVTEIVDDCHPDEIDIPQPFRP